LRKRGWKRSNLSGVGNGGVGIAASNIFDLRLFELTDSAQ
jgi:hypothetical protein